MTARSEIVPQVQANDEKRRVALTSLLAAVLLTALKLTVGLWTGSLGILSEAAHSGLDLVAAAMTFFAVRIASRPADQDHTYGHGKVENLSALFETMLLLITCVWIVYEATLRLFFRSATIELNVWAFVIMIISIVVDFSRSRALDRVAKKYNSQALEADALHFSTDIWSSSVVIFGLVLVLLAEQLRLPWLVKADAGAALGVAAIVIFVSVQLGRRTVAYLLDTVPAGLVDEITQAVRVAGVIDVRQVRVRRSGAETFADVTLTTDRDTSFERSHDIALAAEEAVGRILPGADVVVHMDPIRSAGEGILATTRIMAAQHGLGAHGIRFYEVHGTSHLEFHLEVDELLSVAEAHDKVTLFEKALHQALPKIDHIVTHIEPRGEGIATCKATMGDERKVVEVLRLLAEQESIDWQPHDIKVYQVASEVSLSFHCAMSPGTTITNAHAFTEKLEKRLRARLPSLGRIVIHVEPPEGGLSSSSDPA